MKEQQQNSHDCTRAGFSFSWGKLIRRFIKLVNLVEIGAYERPASESPAVLDHIRSTVTRFIRLAVDGLLWWS